MLEFPEELAQSRAIIAPQLQRAGEFMVLGGLIARSGDKIY